MRLASFLRAARFVGREPELTTLHAALEKIQEAQGSVFVVGGESGVGKSRLLEELHTLALVCGVRVLRAQAEATGRASRQQFLELLRGMVLDTELDDQEAAVIKVLLPELPTLLNRPIPDPPMLGPQETQRRAFAADRSYAGVSGQPS